MDHDPMRPGQIRDAIDRHLPVALPVALPVVLPGGMDLLAVTRSLARLRQVLGLAARLCRPALWPGFVG